MNIEDFFLNIRPAKKFNDCFLASNYDEMPNSWYLISCEVPYHHTDEVITFSAPALFVTAVLNESQIRTSIPFSIQKNRAIILVPPTIITNTRAVLYDVSIHLKKNFNLESNIHIIVYGDLKAYKTNLYVARYTPNTLYNQAMFIGNAIKTFKELTQDDSKFKLQSSLVKIQANYEGYAHRFIASQKEALFKISIFANQPTNCLKIYDTIYQSLPKFSFSDVLDIELSFDEELHYELNLKNYRGLQRISNLAKIKFDNLKIKNSIYKKNFTYKDYKLGILEQIQSSCLLEHFSFFVTKSTIDDKCLMPYLKQMFDNDDIKFEITPIHNIHLNGIFFDKEIMIYFIESIRG